MITAIMYLGAKMKKLTRRYFTTLTKAHKRSRRFAIDFVQLSCLFAVLSTYAFSFLFKKKVTAKK
jgi:hypothetical protein